MNLSPEPNCLAHLQHRGEGLRHFQRSPLHLDTENTSWIKCTGTQHFMENICRRDSNNFSIPTPPYRSEAATPKTGSSNTCSTLVTQTARTRTLVTCYSEKRIYLVDELLETGSHIRLGKITLSHN